VRLIKSGTRPNAVKGPSRFVTREGRNNPSGCDHPNGVISEISDVHISSDATHGHGQGAIKGCIRAQTVDEVRHAAPCESRRRARWCHDANAVIVVIRNDDSTHGIHVVLPISPETRVRAHAIGKG
jgi:hypothetical protein